jgi:hypothetical protein
MKKILFFLLLSVFGFGQKQNFCKLYESDLLKFSTNLISKNINLESKKTQLGYVIKSDEITLLFKKDAEHYSLLKIYGNSDIVKNIWLNNFNEKYNEGSTEYSNTVLKTDNLDARLQYKSEKYYIEIYKCLNN